MKINFRKIEIHNFMSFADESFDFIAQNGMTLVTGQNFDIPNSKNGAGKSTVFQALLFGLYGQLQNKIKTEHIANRNLADRDVRVVVYLDIDGKSYKAVTGLNKRAQGYFQLFEDDNGSEVDITKSSIAETRKFFEEQILHCDISLFLRTILLTSEQNYNFFTLKKQDKRDFIEKLFDISIFGDMYAKIHRDSLDIEKEIISHQNQLVVMTRNKDDYSQRIDDFEKHQTQQKQQLTEQIDRCKAQLDAAASAKVEKNTELIKKYEDAKTKLNDAEQNASKQLLIYKASIQKAQAEIKLLTESRNDKQCALDKHAELLNRLCDDCQNIFLEYHSLTACRDDVSKADKAINDKKSIIEQQKLNYNQLKSKMQIISEKISIVQAKVKELSRAHDEAEAHYDSLSKQLQMLKFSFAQLEQKTNPYVALLDSTDRDIQKQIMTLDDLAKKSRYLKKAEDIVSQDSLKKFIIRDLVGLINSRIKTYLMKMGAKYTCVFDENLDYSFITESGSCELYNFSCGEKKRLEIATCLSFRDFISQRSGISSNILILDEYIDSGIDALAVDSILHILKSFTQQSKQNVFIISHRSEVNNEMFDRTIEIQKKNGISQIHYS